MEAGPALSSRPITVRVRGLPCEQHLAEDVIYRVIRTNSKQLPDYNFSIVPTCDWDNESTALVDFPLGLPDFLLPLKKNPHSSQQFPDNQELITFDRHFVGFTQLSRSVDPIVADVIAICGIDGHAYGSWQSKESPHPMWLRHFLPKDFPNCRIMSWGYSGKLVRLDHATIQNYAREFLEGLKKIRTGNARSRPIIFLAHSFGGIVLVHALLQAQRNWFSDPSFTSTIDSLLGIMFFAVPHGGMDVEDMSQIMGSTDHPRRNLINHLRKDSEQLETERKTFKDFLYHHQGPSSNCKVISFFETEQSPRLQQNENGEWARLGDHCMPLTSDSAVLGLPSQMETCIPLHKDHSSIIKFNSKHDLAYSDVLHHFKALLDPSPKLPSSRSVSRTPSELNPNASQELHVAANQPFTIRKVIIPALLISAFLTASLVPDNNVSQWLWSKKSWGLWGIAVPIALYTAKHTFLEDIPASDPPSPNPRN